MQQNCLYVCIDTKSDTNSIALNSHMLVAKANSHLVRQLIATPNDQVPSKQDILKDAYCAQNNMCRENLPHGIVFNWEHHPEVESFQLNAFDYGWSAEIKENSRWVFTSGGGYFNKIDMDTSNWNDEIIVNGKALDNTMKDSFVHGGTVALFLLKASTRKAKEERKRLYLTEILKLHHNTI